MSDYLSAVVPDYLGTVLSVNPQQTMTEIGSKNQVIHMADDGSEERITFSGTSIFYVTMAWDLLSATDSGTIVDIYHDSNKANGTNKSFRWDHPDPNDNTRYVVRFDGELDRNILYPYNQGISTVKLRVLGTAAT